MTQESDDRLTKVQAELRGVSGKPYRDDADRQRRMMLWRELDRLVREGGR